MSKPINETKFPNTAAANAATDTAASAAQKERRPLIARLKKFSFLSLPIFFFALVFLDYAARFVYRGIGQTRLSSPWPLCFTLGWAMLITGLLSLLPKTPRRILMSVIAVLFGFLAILHGVMYNIFGHFFSFSDMSFATDGAKFFSFTYLNLPKKYLLFVFVYLIMTGTSVFLCENPRPIESRRLKKPWLRPLISVCLCAASAASIVLAGFLLTPKADTLTWGSSYNPADEKEIYREFSDPNRAFKLTGLYQYTARNLAISLGFGVDKASVEELNAYYEQRQISGENSLTGALKDKNLIMIMLESIDTWLMQPEYMPNLCRLSEEGVSFENFYTPLFLSAGTFNTEIISQTGLVPPVTGVSSSIYSTNAFPMSLANLFKNQGYTVNSFHSASPSIYSRGTVHENLGFSAYHSYADMGMPDYQLDSGLINAYSLMAPQGKFFSFVITYSGHGPYTQELENISAPHIDAAQAAVSKAAVEGSAQNISEYTHAVAHAMETDQFIGQLIDRLEEEGRLEDTALLLYADHYGKYMTDKDFLLKIKDVRLSPELYHTPCVLYGGGIQQAKVDKYCSSLDLVPSIINLYDLPGDRRYYAGDDIFGGLGGVVPLPGGAWYDGERWYNGGESDPDPELTSALKRQVSQSMEAVRIDYFDKNYVVKDQS